MGKYRSGFNEPPWVYSPSEVMDWINASNPPHKIKKFHAEKNEKYLKNIEISLDLDVEKKEIGASNFLLKKIKEIAGYDDVKENFEIIPAAELMARALAKAKFSNMMKITMDGNTLYEHPEKKHDIKRSIELMVGMANKTKEGKNIELKATKPGREKCIAHVFIKRIHPRKEHSIDIKIDGKIKEELFNRFLNYVKEHMEVKSEDINTPT